MVTPWHARCMRVSLLTRFNSLIYLSQYKNIWIAYRYLSIKMADTAAYKRYRNLRQKVQAAARQLYQHW